MVEEDEQVHIQAIQGTIGTLTGIPWGIKQIKAPHAWSISTGHRMKIAVIDTGVDFSHPDLKYSLTRGINLVHRNMPPYDDNGHGTHISGTIAAANSTQGMIGVAPDLWYILLRPLIITGPPSYRILFWQSIGAYAPRSISSI